MIKKEVKTVVLKSNGLKCVKAYSQYIKTLHLIKKLQTFEYIEIFSFNIVSDTTILETMKNYYWSLITSIKGNYYFVFYYFYSLWLQSPKLDVILFFLLFRISITF